MKRNKQINTTAKRKRERERERERNEEDAKVAVGKKSTKKEQNNSRQLGVHVSPRGETTARELRASGTLYTGESWTCARQKLESSKERFSNPTRNNIRKNDTGLTGTMHYDIFRSITRLHTVLLHSIHTQPYRFHCF